MNVVQSSVFSLLSRSSRGDVVLKLHRFRVKTTDQKVTKGIKTDTSKNWVRSRPSNLRPDSEFSDVSVQGFSGFLPTETYVDIIFTVGR